MPSLSRIKRRRRHLIATSVLFAAAALAACEAEPQKPSENNTYNVHLYYGKDMNERHSLGRVLGISRCKTAVHAKMRNVEMKIKALIACFAGVAMVAGAVHAAGAK